MAKKSKNSGKEIEGEIKELTEELKRYDGMEYSREREEELKKISDRLASIGKPAVPQLIVALNKHKYQSSWYAAKALGKIGDERAIIHLANALENFDLGEHAKKALKRFGPVCIPEVIKKIEYRIAHPIKEKGAFTSLTMQPLRTIGETRCGESIKFLNELLDDYMSEMPEESFDPTEYNWKYRNIDFFHLLDCMVRQQDKRAIPHIKKARDFFPENYTDHKVCQIAIGRIKKGKVEGHLPMEALEIAFPSGAIMDALSGGKFGWKDTFEEKYGEYFQENEK